MNTTKCKLFEVCGLNADADPEAGLCILHSKDPGKDKNAFAKALERHQKEKGDRFSWIVFPWAVDLSGAVFAGVADFTGAVFAGAVKFIGVTFGGAAVFSGAAFSDAVEFERAQFTKEADFRWARFSGKVGFKCATFSESPDFSRTVFLKGGLFQGVDLKNANFEQAVLKGIYFTESHLGGANFEAAIVDGETLIWDSTINQDTDFTGVGLDSARIEPSLKESLKANIRRRQWQSWYDEADYRQKLINCLLIKPFWMLSDYGSSTKRIAQWFWWLAIGFAFVYWFYGILDQFFFYYDITATSDFARIAHALQSLEYSDFLNILKGGHGVNPGFIDNLFGEMTADGYVSHDPWMVPIRALSFSIVVMTPLEFGNMHVNPGSVVGHVLLLLQVLISYVLLCAIVTRFSVLFNGAGPVPPVTKK